MTSSCGDQTTTENRVVFRWGIICAGRISNDFCVAIRSLIADDVTRNDDVMVVSPNHKIVAVAARVRKDATEFAERHGIQRVYSTYESLVEDDMIDGIYVGSLTSHHFAICKMILEKGGGKAVLCEKTLTPDYADTRELCDLARQHNTFLMEALFSRCLPTYRRLTQQLPTIGEIRYVEASLGLAGMNQIETVRNPEKGGSALLSIGCYPLSAILLAFDGAKPTHVHATGNVNEYGADESVTAVLKFPNGGMATLATSTRVTLTNRLLIIGDRGRIELPENAWAAQKLITPAKGLEHYPFPQTVDTINFSGSSGLRYEAEEVRRCVLEGKLESDRMPLAHSLIQSDIITKIHRQLGVTAFLERQHLIFRHYTECG